MLIFLLAFYLLTCVSLYFLFPKANQEGWKAFVPVLNILTGYEIVGGAKWKTILFFVPILNIFMYANLAIDLITSFGHFKFIKWVGVVLAAPLMFFWIAKDKNSTYGGPTVTQQKEYKEKIQEVRASGKKTALNKLLRNNPYRKSVGREWSEAIIFAVFAAAFLRMFLFEAFIIPTPSMEGSLKQGDFLFVSKMAYGIRMPQTILMVPLLHNRLPIIGNNSYLRRPQLKYRRTKAFESIDLNDPIVFNWPVGDSVYMIDGRSYSIDQVRRSPDLTRKSRSKKLYVRPTDKKDHYIKRCVGTPGDTLQIIDRTIYINGQELENSQFVQFGYWVTTTFALNEKKLKTIGVHSYDIRQRGSRQGKYVYYMYLSEAEKNQIQKWDPQASFEIPPPPAGLWPYDKVSSTWDVDNFGPVFIPRRGATVTLTPHNLETYRKCIRDYENNQLAVRDGKIYINGQATDSYTFTKDYYWGMGDNRHASEDSRMWGFIPEDHIVGKPIFIWMSLHDAKPASGINWKRVFKKGDIF